MFKKIFLFLIIFISASSFANKKTRNNLRVSPITPFLGFLNIELDMPIHKRWTVGPSIIFKGSSSGNTKVSAYALGIRANFYISGKAFRDGWYLGPFAHYVDYEITRKDQAIGDMKGQSGIFSFGSFLGYQWVWDVFNVNLGLGIQSTSESSITLTKDNQEDTYSSDLGTQMSYEATIGFIF